MSVSNNSARAEVEVEVEVAGVKFHEALTELQVSGEALGEEGGDGERVPQSFELELPLHVLGAGAAEVLEAVLKVVPEAMFEVVAEAVAEAVLEGVQADA